MMSHPHLWGKETLLLFGFLSSPDIFALLLLRLVVRGIYMYRENLRKLLALSYWCRCHWFWKTCLGFGTHIFHKTNIYILLLSFKTHKHYRTTWSIYWLVHACVSTCTMSTSHHLSSLIQEKQNKERKRNGVPFYEISDIWSTNQCNAYAKWLT